MNEKNSTEKNESMNVHKSHLNNLFMNWDLREGGEDVMIINDVNFSPFTIS